MAFTVMIANCATVMQGIHIKKWIRMQNVYVFPCAVMINHVCIHWMTDHGRWLFSLSVA